MTIISVIVKNVAEETTIKRRKTETFIMKHLFFPIALLRE